MNPNKQAAQATKTRQITICNKGFARQSNEYVFFPIINLSGKWLKEAGFRAGQIIDINYETGRLIITPSKEQRWLDQSRSMNRSGRIVLEGNHPPAHG